MSNFVYFLSSLLNLLIFSSININPNGIFACAADLSEKSELVNIIQNKEDKDDAVDRKNRYAVKKTPPAMPVYILSNIKYTDKCTYDCGEEGFENIYDNHNTYEIPTLYDPLRGVYLNKPQHSCKCISHETKETVQTKSNIYNTVLSKKHIHKNLNEVVKCESKDSVSKIKPNVDTDSYYKDVNLNKKDINWFAKVQQWFAPYHLQTKHENKKINLESPHYALQDFQNYNKYEIDIDATTHSRFSTRDTHTKTNVIPFFQLKKHKLNKIRSTTFKTLVHKEIFPKFTANYDLPNKNVPLVLRNYLNKMKINDSNIHHSTTKPLFRCKNCKDLDIKKPHNVKDSVRIITLPLSRKLTYQNQTDLTQRRQYNVNRIKKVRIKGNKVVKKAENIRSPNNESYTIVDDLENARVKSTRFGIYHIAQVDLRADDDDRSVAEELEEKVKVLCWVLTYPDNHGRSAIHVKATWGKRCNILLFMSTALEPRLPTVKLNVKEGHDRLWGKTKAAIEHVYENYRNKADWFLKADDDTYVIMENLRYMLSSYDSQDLLYIGRQFKQDDAEFKQGFMSGGAGYVLSRGALDRLYQEGLPNPRYCEVSDVGAEDLFLGACLEKLGVPAIDSRDSDGCGRFFPFLPEDHLLPIYDNFWYWQKLFVPDREGLAGVSPRAISFHYLNSLRMYEMEYLLYYLRPYGINFDNPVVTNFDKVYQKMK